MPTQETQGAAKDCIRALDEYFSSRYSDYTKICAIEGYQTPNLIAINRDGNIERKNNELMLISRQPEAEKVLANFKRGLADTNFTFCFSYPKFFRRIKDYFRKDTFSKILPGVLKNYGETVRSLGEKLTLEPYIWDAVCKGNVYPEKNTLMAIVLVCHMKVIDANQLFGACEIAFSTENVRDVVVEYLITQKVFNEDLRDACLAEYKIECLPIRREKK